MAKNKTSEIPHYELLYLVANKFSENELAPIKTKVEKIITDNGGEITVADDWGKRRLSYAIKGFIYGYYSIVEFNTSGDNLAKIERAIRLTSEVLRHQIIKKRIKTAEELEAEKKMAVKMAAKAAEEAKKENEESTEKTKGKVDIADLDKKLDNILQTDDLF